jgi:hypothetical protein
VIQAEAALGLPSFVMHHVIEEALAKIANAVAIPLTVAPSRLLSKSQRAGACWKVDSEDGANVALMDCVPVGCCGYATTIEDE